jgi:hypothetical protein
MDIVCRWCGVCWRADLLFRLWAIFHMNAEEDHSGIAVVSVVIELVLELAY